MPSAPQPVHYLVIAALAAATALFMLWRFFARLRRDRMVADTPAVRLRSAAQGYVKVSGSAQPAGAAATPAPLTRRPCVWWAYSIAEQERDSKGNVHWHTIENATSVELFVLRDDDGVQCLVGPVSAEITPTVSNTWYGTEAHPSGPPPAITPLLPQSRYRYSERLLGVGTRVCVMGELRSHSELGDRTAAAAAKLHEWKQDQAALLRRFDANHDGRLDAEEWEAARVAAAREAEAGVLESDVVRTNIISAPVNGEPFLIAPFSADQLERRERHYAAAYFVLGLLGVIVCAWALRHAG